MKWSKGRGKLGLFKPLPGDWRAETQTDEIGKVTCTRTFKKALGNKSISLTALWEYSGKNYEEWALFGTDKEKQIRFWSFTSDGKQSEGDLADCSDIHPQAIGFQAQMDMGLARQVYWPDGEIGFNWVVESHTKKGWNRFVVHHYLPVEG